MNSIADVVGGAGLQMWAELALVLFLIAFATILTQVMTTRQSTFTRAADLPFDDDVQATAPTAEREN